MWYSIEEWSKEKAEAWLARADRRFNYKVKEQITRGKKPNLANQSKDFQDIGNEHCVGHGMFKRLGVAAGSNHCMTLKRHGSEVPWTRP